MQESLAKGFRHGGSRDQRVAVSGCTGQLQIEVADDGGGFDPGMLLTLTRSPAPQDPLEELTERESEILKLVGRGLTNREIGERFHRSEKTIMHYITNILQKLHVRSRVEAAMLAVRGSRGNIVK